LTDNPDIFLIGITFTLIGGLIWFFRKPVPGGRADGFMTVAESISPWVTMLGVLILLFGVAESLFNLLPNSK
jgi:hypothetical protein